MKTSAMHQQPTWNNYLTDNDYKLSKEELIKKKKLFVSKNNILIDFEEGIGSKKRYNGLHKTTKRQFASTSMLASSSGKLRKGKKEVILAQKSDDHDDSSVDCHDFNDDCEITALDMLIQGEDDLPHVNDFHETPERSSRRSYHAGGNSKSSVDTVKSNVVTDHGVSEVSLDRSYRTSHKGSIAKTIKNSGAHAPRQASYEPENQIQVDDLIAQVAHLTTEIQTYEQLVGKRSVFDVEVCTIRTMFVVTVMNAVGVPCTILCLIGNHTYVGFGGNYCGTVRREQYEGSPKCRPFGVHQYDTARS